MITREQARHTHSNINKHVMLRSRDRIADRIKQGGDRVATRVHHSFFFLSSSFTVFMYRNNEPADLQHCINLLPNAVADVPQCVACDATSTEMTTQIQRNFLFCSRVIPQIAHSFKRTNKTLTKFGNSKQIILLYLQPDCRLSRLQNIPMLNVLGRIQEYIELQLHKNWLNMIRP